MAKRKRISSEILSGVYSITNRVNNKLYVGSSRDIYGRWVQHKNHLTKNKHHNIHLQRAWNQYGEDNFSFEIIELCAEEDLFVNEQKWYDFYRCGDEKYGYNLSNIARCPSYRATFETLKDGEQTISYEQFQEIINLLENTNISIPKIAVKLGAPERTIYQIYFKQQYKELTKDCEFIRRKNGSNSILTENQVLEIVERLKRDEFNSDIAKYYNVGVGTIDDIRNHKTWKEFTDGISFGSIKGRKRSVGKRVCQYDLEGNIIAIYDNARIAEKCTDVSYKLISAVCNGSKLTAHGFVWRFEGDSFDKYATSYSSAIKVDQYDKEGNFIKTWESEKEIKRNINVDVCSVLNGRTNSAGGFYWCKHGERFSIPEYKMLSRRLA